MNQSNRLYFIPILVKAIDSPYPEQALKEAFKTITRLGELPDYQEGYKQYEAFIAAGIEGIKEDPGIKGILIERLLTVLATDTFTGTEELKNEILGIIHNNPELDRSYNKTVEGISSFIEQDIPVELELFINDVFISKKELPEGSKEVVFADIDPGNYEIKLSNGRTLWNGKIDKKHILWDEAYPGKDLPMAADTGEISIQPTTLIPILNGEMKIKIYPGPETGKLVVSLNEHDTKQK